jgi:hypothetical protein
MHVYGLRPRKDHRGVDLISDALPFVREPGGRLIRSLPLVNFGLRFVFRLAETIYSSE